MGLNLGLSLIQNMKQELRMSPQIQLAIRHLQLSRTELIEEINRELMSNPLLEDVESMSNSDPNKNESGPEKTIDLDQHEISDSRVSRRERRRGQAEREQQSNSQSQQVQASETQVIDLNSAEGAHEARMEMDWDKYLGDDWNGRREMDTIRVSNEDYIAPETTYVKSRTLQEHLHEQLILSHFTDSEREIAEVLLNNIDDDGYLRALTAEEVSNLLQLDLELVEEVIESIQQFDPVGVCSRDLRECFLAQCKMLGLSAHLHQIIDKHLQDVERNRLPLVAKAMKLSVAKVSELVEELKQLDPRPGSQYSSEVMTYVTPDVYVDLVEGEYKVRVNDFGLPRLKVNRFYREMLRKSSDKEGEKYVVERLKAAEWFVKSLEQRKQTIVRVMECILEVQQEFFLNGPEYLKPLVLRQIAERLDLHESTISRVTSNKYVYTPRGLYELKFFFNSKIQGGDGNEDLAGEAVKMKIKRLIAEENPRKPLSDQKLVKLLSEDGVSIARRTVAKYREAMGIGSSSQRRSHV